MEESNLPVPWDDENVPVKAYDIGEASVRPNPRATDLGYVEGAEVSIANNFAGVHIMYDEGDGAAKIECDPDTFIADVRAWA